MIPRHTESADTVTLVNYGLKFYTMQPDCDPDLQVMLHDAFCKLNAKRMTPEKFKRPKFGN